MRPKLGSAPCSAVFTSGELATARATGSTAPRSPRTTMRADPLRALAVGHDLDRELAQQRVHRLAERSSSALSGSTATPEAPFASTNTVSLVDSWPSTRDAVERALHASRR